jgi:hypothetical protein
VKSALTGHNVALPRTFLRKEGAGLAAAADGVINSPEGVVSVFGISASSISDGIVFSSALFGLYTMLRSNSFGGVGIINPGGAAAVDLYGAAREFFKFLQLDGSPGDGRTDHTVDGVLSAYPAFAAAFGNSHESNDANYRVVARDDGQNATERRKTDMIAAIGEDRSLNCVSARKVNVILQILLLSEMAEKGTANGTNLDNGADPTGYTDDMAMRLIKLVKEITPLV